MRESTPRHSGHTQTQRLAGRPAVDPTALADGTFVRGVECEAGRRGAKGASLQAAAPTERHSVRRLLLNRRPTDAILLQSCSVPGAGSRDF